MSAQSFVRPLALMGLLCACAALPGRALAQEPAESPQKREERERHQFQEQMLEKMKREHDRRVLEELANPRSGGAVIVGGRGSGAASEADRAGSRMAWFFGAFDDLRIESTFGEGSLARQRFFRLVEEPYFLVLTVDYEKGAPVGSGWALSRRWASFDLALEDEAGLSALKALRAGRPKEASVVLPRDRFEEAYAAYRRTNPAAKRVRIETSPEGTAPELFIMESLGLVLEPARVSPESGRANLARPGIEAARGNGLKVVDILGDSPGASAPLIRADIILAVSPVEPPGGRPVGMLVAKKPVITVEREGRSVEITAADLPELMTLRHLLRTVQDAQKTE